MRKISLQEFCPKFLFSNFYLYLNLNIMLCHKYVVLVQNLKFIYYHIKETLFKAIEAIRK